MNQGQERPSDVFIDRSTRTSLFWLGATLFFAGVPLLVYFTAPGATRANLFAAAILGIPLFAKALWELGRFRAILLYDESRSFTYVVGNYHRRSIQQFKYDWVTAIDVKRRILSSKGGSTTW